MFSFFLCVSPKWKVTVRQNCVLNCKHLAILHTYKLQKTDAISLLSLPPPDQTAPIPLIISENDSTLNSLHLLLFLLNICAPPKLSRLLITVEQVNLLSLSLILHKILFFMQPKIAFVLWENDLNYTVTHAEFTIDIKNRCLLQVLLQNYASQHACVYWVLIPRV